MNWRCRLSAPTAFMMPISRVRSRTLISIVFAMPRAETSKRHRGDAGHPAEDQKINESLSLDEFEGGPGLEAQLGDASDDVLDVLLGIHEHDRLVHALVFVPGPAEVKVHRRLVGQEHVGIHAQGVPGALPFLVGRFADHADDREFLGEDFRLGGGPPSKGLPQEPRLPAS